MKHCFILGTRPEIIKLSPLIRVAQSRKLDFSIIHTNQHYTASMDEVFFRELELPAADVNLHIGSGDHSAQTGRMLIAIGDELARRKPDVVYVEGDTNTVLAGALAAAKQPEILVAHVEAGLRSYDRSMPEELNRIVTDHVSDLLFAPTKVQEKILHDEHISHDKVFVTGNSIVDAVREHLVIAGDPHSALQRYGVKAHAFALLTMHRPANVDDPAMLTKMLGNLQRVAQDIPMLFPVHPRTKKAIDALDLPPLQGITMIEPVGYLDMLRLMQQAQLILTDSGGIQEEACILKVPCITLRKNTERPETVDVGASVLVGSDAKKLEHAVTHVASLTPSWKNPFGDGYSAERMIDIATEHVA